MAEFGRRASIKRCFAFLISRFTPSRPPLGFLCLESRAKSLYTLSFLRLYPISLYHSIRPRYQDILPPQDMSTDWTSDPDYSYSVFHEEVPYYLSIDATSLHLMITTQHRGQDDEAQNDPYPAPQHSFEANPANSPCPTDGFSIIQPCSFPPYNPHGYSQSPRQPHSYSTLASPSPVSFHPHSSGSESSSPGLYHPQPNLNRRQLSPHDFYYPNALGQNPQASPSFSTVRPLTANTPPVYDYDQTDFSLVIYNQPQTPEAHTNRSVHTHHDQLRFFKNTPLESGHAHLFVPQKMYKPHTNSDRRRYVEEVGLEPPILFLSDDPANHGISLSDALHSRVKNLLHREEQVFQDRGPSVSIRLEVSCQIPLSYPCLTNYVFSGRDTGNGADRFRQKILDHLPAPSPVRNLPKTSPNVCLVLWRFVPISIFILALLMVPFVISRKQGDTLWMKKQTIGGKSATDPKKFDLMTLCSSVCIMFRWAAGSHIYGYDTPQACRNRLFLLP